MVLRSSATPVVVPAPPAPPLAEEPPHKLSENEKMKTVPPPNPDKEALLRNNGNQTAGALVKAVSVAMAASTATSPDKMLGRLVLASGQHLSPRRCVRSVCVGGGGGGSLAT